MKQRKDSEKLIRIKLLKNGNDGAKIEYSKPAKSKGLHTFVPVEESPPFPAPESLSKALNKLQLYFLISTGYWNQEWTAAVFPSFDKNNKTNSLDLNEDNLKELPNEDQEHVNELFDKCTITGIKTNREKSYVEITGKMKMIGGTKGMSTPKISEDNIEVADYMPEIDKLFELVKEIEDESFDFLINYTLRKPVQYLLDIAKSDEEKESIESLDEDEQEKMYIEKLEKSGKFTVIDNKEEINVEVSSEETEESSDEVNDNTKSNNKEELEPFTEYSEEGLNSKVINDLKAICNDRDIAFTSKARKSDIVKLILEKQEEKLSKLNKNSVDENVSSEDVDSDFDDFNDNDNLPESIPDYKKVEEKVESEL